MQRLIPLAAAAALLACQAARADTVSVRLDDIRFDFSADGQPVSGSPGGFDTESHAHFDDGSACGDASPWPSGCTALSIHVPGVDLAGLWSGTQIGSLRADAAVTRPGAAYDLLLYQYSSAGPGSGQGQIVLEPGVSLTLTANLAASFDAGASASGYALAVGLLSLWQVDLPDERIDSLVLMPGDPGGTLSVTYLNDSGLPVGLAWEAQLEIHGAVSAVPEPGRAALLVAGLLLAAAARRPYPHPRETRGRVQV